MSRLQAIADRLWGNAYRKSELNRSYSSRVVHSVYRSVGVARITSSNERVIDLVTYPVGQRTLETHTFLRAADLAVMLNELLNPEVST